MTEPKLSRYHQTRADSGTVYPVNVDHAGVTGVIAVTFTEPTHVYARTEGHVNDDLTILTYKGTEFLVSLHAYLENGQWQQRGQGGYGTKATRRDNWSDATATQNLKLEEAVIATVNAHADSPEFMAARKAGTIYNAEIDRDNAQRKIDDLTEQLKAERAKLRKANKRVSDAAAL